MKDFIDCKNVSECIKTMRSDFQNLYEEFAHDYKAQKKDYYRLACLMAFTQKISAFFDANFYLMTGVNPERKILSEKELKKIAEMSKQEEVA